MEIIYNNKFNIELLKKLVPNKIELFNEPKSQEKFWDDEHISKYMLEAHLNTEWDAASRKHSTIKQTCGFINSIINNDITPNLIDLGCGPGLYCSELYDKGFNVIGVDYSKRSIEYAKENAIKHNRKINYLYKDYLTMDYKNDFDIAMMIYCDFGVLSKAKRKLMLQKVYKALKPEGYFIFDIWSNNHQELNRNYKSWDIKESGGFWSSIPYIEFVNKIYYEDYKVSLKQHVILKEDGDVQVYNLWEQLYTVDSISRLLEESGFKVIGIYGDLTGAKYNTKSESIGIVARKEI